MISNTAQINTFVGGMDMDTDINLLSNDRYRYAENVRVITNDGGTTGILQNIEGVRRYTSYVPADEIIIGTTTVDDIGVIITRLPNRYNRIYRVTGLDSNAPTLEVVCQGNLGLGEDYINEPNISIVGNYESDTNVKIYFTDGKSQIKVLNIMSNKYMHGSEFVDSDGNILNPKILDITPSAKLNPFKVIGVSEGNLKAGMVTYCYQLFNIHGTETAASSLSELVHLTKSTSNQGSQKYKGTRVDDYAGKSVTMSTKLDIKDFDRCRVIRIHYSSNTKQPTITIIDEVDITNDGTTFTYTDYGMSYLSELTIDQFNAITGYQFVAQTLAKMQNRLFAANITEQSWNPKDKYCKPYDARSYRADSSGTVKLLSADSSKTITFNISDTVAIRNVSATHDCINPFNSQNYEECMQNDMYIYNKDGKLGGTGINIDYTFVTTDIILSKRQKQERLDQDCSMDIPAIKMSKHTIEGVDIDYKVEQPVDDKYNDLRTPNYADPYIASKYRGYMRDEVYRFGIVFYNDKNVASPVFWIGDIRMPRSIQVPTYVYENNTLIGKALGVNFRVKEMPVDAVSYEIVRCDRTEADRTIVSQIVGNFPYTYNIQETDQPIGDGEYIQNSIEMRPTPFFFNSNRHLIVRNREIDAMLYNISACKDYFRMVSPEICLQGKDIEHSFENNVYLDLQGFYYSPFVGGKYMLHNEGGSAITWTIPYSNFATAKNVLQPDGKTLYNESVVALLTTLANDGDIFVFPYRDKDGNRTFYNSIIAKYFVPFYTYTYRGTRPRAEITDAKYALNVPYNVTDNLTAYNINVGTKTYTNYSMSSFANPGNQAVIGPAGPCVIAHIPELGYTIDTLSMEHNLDMLVKGDKANAIPIFNVRRTSQVQYGGNTYGSRSNSIYISTSSFGTNSNEHTFTFGGDIYLSILDYPNTMIFQRPDINDRRHLKFFIGSYIPFESTINMNLFQGDQVHRTVTGDGYVDSYLQLEPTQMQQFHSQDDPYYLYNTVYSVRNNVKKFIPNSLYAEDDTKFSNRILASQAKTNNEVIDQWSKFKVADYLDVDNQFGEISNLKTFKDRLFYFQDSGVGIAAVNERSLITDDNVNQLVLGTGGILSRFDYITNTNGDSIKNDKSIINSDNVLYWYDYDKNEICDYNGQVSQLSKEKSVQTHLNSNYKKDRKHNTSLFDKKYNEVWFRLFDKSLIFNEQLGRFTSFYTFTPVWALPFSDRVVGIKSNGLYSINDTNTNGSDIEDKDAKLQIVINKDFTLTKVFDNIRLHGNFKDERGKLIVDGIVDYLKFDTKHQQAIKQNDKEPIVFDYREDTYRIPVPRADVNEDEYSLPARLRGKTMTCEYHFDKQKHHTFEIPQITTTYRHSMI